MKAPVKLGTPC